jgi:uracil-DNA glycosylase
MGPAPSRVPVSPRRTFTGAPALQSETAGPMPHPPIPSRDEAAPERFLEAMREAVDACRACPLYENATQGVMGRGPAGAPLMLVGEQPGDKEDLEGEPFVGPAGRLLDEALTDAGIERVDAFVTNVVKHFKWTPKGRMRLHQSPNRTEVLSCLPWLKAEIEAVQPRVLVALGATAGKALLGEDFRVTRQRGEVFESDLVPGIMATVHPSAVLRQRGRPGGEEAYAAFVMDLRRAAALLNGRT